MSLMEQKVFNELHLATCEIRLTEERLRDLQDEFIKAGSVHDYKRVAEIEKEYKEACQKLVRLRLSVENEERYYIRSIE